jgi:hypothetical protein
MTWNKVTEVLPPLGRDLLVWTGRYMLVSDAFIYDTEYIMGLKDMMGMEYCAMLTKSKGYFQEFGEKHYFDDPDVYWMELPMAPGTPILGGQTK